MKPRILNSIVFSIFILIGSVPGCATAPPAPPTSTSTPVPPSATNTALPTDTPTSTPLPTRTPNVAATEHMAVRQAETDNYLELGFIKSDRGRFVEYEDFEEEWAQLNWYQWWLLDDKARNFYMSAHFKWSSAYRNADISGCGFAFGIQDNDDNYVVFLDRSQILFIDTDQSLGYSRTLGPTRGTGRVKFDNPADKPVEADFTLIVWDGYAYVLVDDQVVGEYTLSKSKSARGNLGLTMLSGTNKDFGTRCEMTDLHAWIPRGN